MKNELEIYVHIPFCVQKCRYCDFLSAPADEKTKEQYMEALCREISEKSRQYKQYCVSSVFIGGGTPSCVKAEWICRLMECIKRNYRMAGDAEVSMEINPGTVNRDALNIYYKAGINRLSIGLQSVRREELAVLGRIHSYEQFLEAYYAAREVGFTNINVDIMSGLPGQTFADYEESLCKITGLEPAPEHISAYSLIIEEGTPFFEEYEQGKLELPEEETERRMYERTEVLLRKCGYERYEISNYARKGRECRHNIGYWTRKNYVGFGIGAASMVENVRFQNGTGLLQYVEDPCGCEENRQVLSVKEQMEETMFLGLRLVNGVSLQAFEEIFKVSMEQVYGTVMKKHVEQGLLEFYSDEEKSAGMCNQDIKDEAQAAENQGSLGKYIRLTCKGMDVSNYVMADFLEP